MSFDEYIFNYFNKRVKRLKKDPFKDHVQCELEECKGRLELLASMLHGTKMKIIATDVETRSMLDCIFLPTKINFHKKKEDNFYHYKYLILSHFEARKRHIFVKESEDYRHKQKIFTHKISKLIIESYPQFNHWPFDSDKFPVPILPENKISQIQISEASDSQLHENQSKADKELKVKTSGRPKFLELEQDEENPVIHNFEKVKTLDDFVGGNREADGQEEENSQDALDELKLEAITRSNTPTETTVKSDAIIENATIVTLEENFDEKYFSYPEWFYKEGKYRENWCRVVEQDIETSSKHHIDFDQKLYNKFEHRFFYLFNENKKLRKQLEGPEIELDEVIRHQVEKQVYHEDYPRIFVRDSKKNQDVAFFFLIDTSLSTDSYIENRRVLTMAKNVGTILLKVFQSIEDRVAFYSFHSNTRNRCVLQKVKSFEETTKHGEQTMAALHPHGYTRIGAALRHSKEKFKDIKAKNKFLIIISDAKPTDYDQYEGEHGIRDVRKAISELDNEGIQGHVFSFSKSHLKMITQIFDHRNFTYVSDEEDLMESFFYFLQNQLV